MGNIEEKNNKLNNKNSNEDLQPQKAGKEHPSKDGVPFTGKESSDSTDTKGTKSGPKEDATVFDKSGKVEKVSLINSEKALLSVFEELKNAHFYNVLLGKVEVCELQQCIFDAFLTQRNLLKKARAFESAKVLTETFKRFRNGIPYEVSLKDVQKTRMNIQDERRQKRLQKELSLKEKRINEIAKQFGIPAETAKAMYLAGALK